ncbi:unnamed protein product [Brassica rapa subsp. trilocularis]
MNINHFLGILANVRFLRFLVSIVRPCQSLPSFSRLSSSDGIDKV